MQTSLWQTSTVINVWNNKFGFDCRRSWTDSTREFWCHQPGMTTVASATPSGFPCYQKKYLERPKYMERQQSQSKIMLQQSTVIDGWSNNSEFDCRRS